jgi:hypothetical protein
MKYLNIAVFSFSLIFSQNSDQKIISPCKDPLITLAEEEGIKAIPLKDIRKFKKLLKACERQGEQKRMERLVYNDWQRDYEKAKKMQSWSSTHAMCVFVSFAYFFAGQALATDPGK